MCIYLLDAKSPAEIPKNPNAHSLALGYFGQKEKLPKRKIPFSQSSPSPSLRSAPTDSDEPGQLVYVLLGWEYDGLITDSWF